MWVRESMHPLRTCVTSRLNLVASFLPAPLSARLVLGEMAGALVLKNTFLDVADSEEEPIGRCQTMPDLRWPASLTAEEDTSHIAALNSLWSALAWPFLGESSPTTRCGEHALR